MSVQDPRGFNEWLRAQLKAKRMSQRQLAQQAGVDHSTISRLIRGDRTPSLGTATKLARGLREIHDESDSPTYFGQVSASVTNPTARVEYALRADELLSDAHVRQVMEFYLTIRARRMNGGSGNRNGQAMRAPSMVLSPSGRGAAGGAWNSRRAPVDS
jgi:transcriptional regulator with XRE-family HTH domain